MRSDRLHKILLAVLFGTIVGIGFVNQAPVSAQSSGCEFATIPGTIPGAGRCLYLPTISMTVSNIPQTVFDAIPVMGAATDRPAAAHGDLNLALRSYVETNATLTLIDVGGDTDSNAPQMDGIFTPPRLPTFTKAYRVHEWDWNCATDDKGCRAGPIGAPDVTLIEMAVTGGEAISIPSRNPRIYPGDYKVLVLYAEATRITIAYTREDTAANGYVVHMEDLRVDPALVTLYNQMNAAGRSNLPALRNGERLGNASGSTIKVVMRDSGSFMDPRVRKDWWMGY